MLKSIDDSWWKMLTKDVQAACRKKIIGLYIAFYKVIHGSLAGGRFLILLWCPRKPKRFWANQLISPLGGRNIFQNSYKRTIRCILCAVLQYLENIIRPTEKFTPRHYIYTLYSSTVKTLLHSSNMQKQKLHHFCNRSSPDDGPKSSRKY